MMEFSKYLQIFLSTARGFTRLRPSWATYVSRRMAIDHANSPTSLASAAQDLMNRNDHGHMRIIILL